MYIMKIIPRKNMKFSHYVKSYLIFIRLRIRFLKLFRSTYKNYLSTINHVLRKKYPFDGILKNGKICRYNQYSEVYYTLLNLDYNSKEDSITVSIKNSPKKIKLFGAGNAGDIQGIFQREDYGSLPVKDNVVIDVGSNICDSTIYFCLHGAQKVIAIDPFPTNYYFAKKNIENNGFSNNVEILLAGCSDKTSSILFENENDNSTQKIPLLTLTEIVKKYNIDSGILKIDCEGCEYDIIFSSSRETLRKFSHIQIEYHYGYKNLKEKLEKYGFNVAVTQPQYCKSFDLNRTSASIYKENSSSEYIMSKKPKNPKMFVGWLYAIRS